MLFFSCHGSKPPPARPRSSTRAPAYPRLAIALAAVVLAGCPIYPENGVADEPHPAGAPVGPWGESGPGGPVEDAALEVPDSGAVSAGREGGSDVLIEETGPGAEGDAFPADATGGDESAPAADADALADATGEG